EKVISLLEEVFGGIGGLKGVHCCGNTDWSVFTDTQSIDIINFDAFGFLDKLVLYADNLKKFFSRGGMLCWGIVPTQEFNPGMKEDLLLNKINEGISALVKKGVDKKVVCDNLILSPACGLGAMETLKAEQIFRLLSKLSAKIKK
ncbi:MAG: methionine synthase, partial [Candidatus Omnitrophota bacterium]|nr:methionine synthase [Candidatus Omnitrophota bacterium]